MPYMYDLWCSKHLVKMWTIPNTAKGNAINNGGLYWFKSSLKPPLGTATVMFVGQVGFNLNLMDKV